MTRTGDPALVREINLSIILNALREHSSLSRAELAKLTGLSKATVSSLVQELARAQLVRETGAGKRQVGRPAIGLELDPGGGCIIGTEIGIDLVSVILTNFSTEVIWRYQEQTNGLTAQDQLIQRTVRIVREACHYGERQGLRVLGLGLGIPGLVDVQSGMLLFAPNLRWHEVPLRALFEHEFRFPIYVDNEANMGALGESYFGAARGCRNVLYISGGVGIGGGFVLDGCIVPGALGLAGEVGHMTLAPDGPFCNCGNRGCWETLADQKALFRRVRQALAGGEASIPHDWMEGNLDRLSIQSIVEAARVGDAVAGRALLETGEYLGIGIASLVNALNPERVILGGPLCLAGEILVPEIERVVEARALKWSRRDLKILCAAHGLDACAMGGIATVYQRVLSQPKAAHGLTYGTVRREARV